ncbi:MAG: GtrA family protein [Muribaculaceae bacterium]|nr:GtrA family protein [Muribaculaceae bacterium]
MKLDKAEMRKTSIQLLKYGVIGVMNTLITLVSFYLLNTWAGVSYGIANIVGYVLGVINSFLWNRNWVFKTHHNFGREALLFTCGFCACWILQGIVSLVLLEGLGWKNLPIDTIPFLPMENAGQNIVMVIAMVVYTMANYMYNRMITFRESQASAS